MMERFHWGCLIGISSATVLCWILIYIKYRRTVQEWELKDNRIDEKLFHALQYNGTTEQMFNFCRGRKDALGVKCWTDLATFPKKNVSAEPGEWVVFDGNGTLGIYADDHFREMFYHIKGDTYKAKAEGE